MILIKHSLSCYGSSDGTFTSKLFSFLNPALRLSGVNQGPPFGRNVHQFPTVLCSLLGDVFTNLLQRNSQRTDFGARELAAPTSPSVTRTSTSSTCEDQTSMALDCWFLDWSGVD
ncbi:hypothetical protein VNO80_03397 [Phaseolus coccineus]|uniref:Uncharacterized protein n=1 Tax=Phaseolus coccineus TaxID=3886 RepID=A0AAN9NW04_PHACN